MAFFKLLGNVRLPHHKKTAGIPAVTMPPPNEVLIPMAQHIGAPAIPVVKVGDEVKVGTKIGDAQGGMSSYIYASVSGKVVKIEDYLTSNGDHVPSVRIASDGLMTLDESIAPPTVENCYDFIQAIKKSGLVGLGGAGFPTHIKLAALGRANIDCIIINAAECEPYVTSDTRTMIDDVEWIEKGLELFRKYAPVSPKFVIAIEGNKPECISLLKARFAGNSDVEIKVLPEKYPQGAEKILVYNSTKRIISEGKLPADVGVLVINVTSLAFMAKYVETGMPLVSRTLTVDGGAIAEPKNVTAPIGASIGDIIEFAGGFKETPRKILFGGPMMGFAAHSLDEPIVKSTGIITCLSKNEVIEPEPTACIHCGRCIAACPMNLNASAYSEALTIENNEERIAALKKHKVNLCMECGSCNYVCPASRPLVQNSRLGKTQLRADAAHMAKLKK